MKCTWSNTSLQWATAHFSVMCLWKTNKQTNWGACSQCEDKNVFDFLPEWYIHYGLTRVISLEICTNAKNMDVTLMLKWKTNTLNLEDNIPKPQFNFILQYQCVKAVVWLVLVFNWYQVWLDGKGWIYFRTRDVEFHVAYSGAEKVHRPTGLCVISSHLLCSLASLGISAIV